MHCGSNPGPVSATSVSTADLPIATLSVAVGRSSVLTEVADTGPGFDPQCIEHSGDRNTGWGLFLVERLADRWGVRHEGPNKRVWFELRRA